MTNKSKPHPNSDAANSPSDMSARITHYLQAGYPGLYLVSPEDARVEAELKAIARTLDYNLCFWSVISGLVETKTKKIHQAQDPLEALQTIESLPEKSVILLKDFHLFLADPNPVLICKMKEALGEAKTQSKTLIVLGCRLVLPPELEREMTVLDFALPDKKGLAVVLDGIVESAKLGPIQGEDRERILEAATGLTTIEAENAFALSYAQCKAVQPAVVAKEKAQAVKKNGLLEILDAGEDLDSIGGLEVLKTWLIKRKMAFSQRAIEYGLPTPKGLMILGIAGTGKSLTAKATAKVFGVPLLKLDAGRIFAGVVGQSESNLRSVIQTAEAIAPCCLWIDELEKAFSGSKSSGATDGGTSSRVFGSFLSWMQEKNAAVFVVATANDVSQLPPEMLRKGRWDELFFVDLPNMAEREMIWAIQIAKYGRDPKDFDLVQLARATDGLTGSEIESAFVEALYQSFDAGNEPTDLTIAQVLTEVVPLSRLMAEQITGLRHWAKGRARLATAQQTESRLRKMAA